MYSKTAYLYAHTHTGEKIDGIRVLCRPLFRFHSLSLLDSSLCEIQLGTNRAWFVWTGEEHGLGEPPPIPGPGPPSKYYYYNYSVRSPCPTRVSSRFTLTRTEGVSKKGNPKMLAPAGDPAPNDISLVECARNAEHGVFRIHPRQWSTQYNIICAALPCLARPMCLSPLLLIDERNSLLSYGAHA